MSDQYVREVGQVISHYGTRIGIGVDYDTVSVSFGPSVGVLLTAAQAGEFAQLFVSAVWQAGQSKARMDAETGG